VSVRPASQTMHVDEHHTYIHTYIHTCMHAYIQVRVGPGGVRIKTMHVDKNGQFGDWVVMDDTYIHTYTYIHRVPTKCL
jgi:hypothetical protein